MPQKSADLAPFLTPVVHSERGTGIFKKVNKTKFWGFPVVDTVCHLVVNSFMKLSYFSLLPIGDGNFAVVRKCRSRKTKADFALKIIDKSKCQGTFHK